MELQNLRGLECVEAEVGADRWCGYGCALVIVGLILALSTHWNWLWAVMGAGILAALLANRFSRRGIRVDQDAITVTGLFRRAQISWEEVIDASLRHSPDGRGTVVVASSATIIRFRPEFGSERLEASIWQHLRQVGRADGFQLSEDALSIWAAIPDEIPRTMEYEEPEIPELGPHAKYVLTDDSISEELFGMSDEELRRAKRDAPLIELMWADATDVAFPDDIDDYDFSYLAVVANDGRKIHIRDWGSSDAHGRHADRPNARLLLAVIRRARELPSQPAIVIPRGLRDAGCIGSPSQ